MSGEIYNKCIENCDECSNDSSCETCSTVFFENNGKCILIIENCENYDDNGKCSSCFIPYKITSDRKCKNPQEQAHIYGFAERLETEPRYLKQVTKTRRDVVEFKNKKRRLVEDSIESYQMDCRNWFSLEESLAY